MQKISKAIGGVAGSGVGYGVAALAMPPDTPWWGTGLVIVACTFIGVFFSPANQP